MRTRRFGVFLVDEGFITPLQLEEALEAQERFRSTPLGQILVELGHLSTAQLQDYRARHLRSLCTEGGRRMRFGDFLIEEDLLQAPIVQAALREQSRRRSLRLGQVLVELGHLSSSRLAQAVRQQLRELHLALP